MSILSQLPFRTSVEAEGGRLYLVGGYLRDLILGKAPKDIDILITGVPMDKLEALLGAYGRVDAVGKSFGVIKFNSAATGEIDIAIPRTEKPTGMGGHQGFEVVSDHTLPVEADLARRDITINAIAMDIDGNYIDPFGGLSDIRSGVIKMVSPQSFSDDPLRMLRVVQFASRFKFTVDTETLDEITKNARRITEISSERILIEFDKIIKKGDSNIAIKLLKETGLFFWIFGMKSFLIVHDEDLWSVVETMGEFIFLCFLGPLNVSGSAAEFYREKLKGDVDTFKEIEALEMAYDHVVGEPSSAVSDRLKIFQLYKKCSRVIESRILPFSLYDEIQIMRHRKLPFLYSDLEVDGNDLIRQGISGKEIGVKLNQILTLIYDETLRNNKEEILDYLKYLKK